MANLAVCCTRAVVYAPKLEIARKMALWRVVAHGSSETEWADMVGGPFQA